MNEQLDPKLSRLFSSYAPEFESSAFLVKMHSALDRAERRARWRFAVGWMVIAFVVGALAVFASGPLAKLVALTDHTAMSLASRLTLSITPLNLTLVTALVGLCLHRRIRAMLAL
jgi:hypothetical protein